MQINRLIIYSFLAIPMLFFHLFHIHTLPSLEEAYMKKIRGSINAYCVSQLDLTTPSLINPLSPPPPNLHNHNPSTAHAFALACLPTLPAPAFPVSVPALLPSPFAFFDVDTGPSPASLNIPDTTRSPSITCHNPSTKALPLSPNSPFPSRNNNRPRTCHAMHRCAGYVERERMASSGIV
jgi:hypothetical protein